MVRLPGHVLQALARATMIPPADARARAAEANQPLTLTIVLKRNDQTDFERYLHDVYNPHSKSFHHYLTQKELADHFGPSRHDYHAVLTYLCANGFKLVRGSANRLTLTVDGTRGAAERIFDIRIDDYRIGGKTGFANDANPALPSEIASNVQAVIGLSDLAQPRRDVWLVRALGCAFISGACLIGNSSNASKASTEWNDCFTATNNGNSYDKDGIYNICADPSPSPASFSRQLSSSSSEPAQEPIADASGSPWNTVTGAGQKIGLVEFDTFQISDVEDYLALTNEPAALIDQLSQVHVNGGATAGPNQDEVLLDIDTALTVAPGAKTVVYDAPFTAPGADFQAVFNQMIDDGVTIISNSWAYCEDQTNLADVTSINSILAAAAASGISVFNGSGDTGSTCLDGSPNTVSVPADSPHATAVGGTSLTSGPGYVYESESWWNGASATPPTGQGGFGTSKFFASPPYQSALNPSASRSVPDVVVEGDPAHGVQLCEASAGGCPTGLIYGGTSFAAPIWAAFTALLNQAHGSNLGEINLLLYLLATTNGFHSAASMGSDFAHVGLGSPILSKLNLLLNGKSAGTPSASLSEVTFDVQIPTTGVVPNGVFADGTTEGFVVAALRDAEGNSVSGKTVQLSATAGSHATITPASVVSNISNGTATFTVKDQTTEKVTFTATDVTDGVKLTTTAGVPFVTPPATSGSIGALPTSVTADGISTTTITVLLTDTLGRATPGKFVTISQGSGNSIIKGPSPSVTDSSGEIQFTATDTNNETVIYSGVDVTDGNLPVPGSASVTFSSAVAPGCAQGTPTAPPGMAIVPVATGFAAQDFFYGDISWGGCPGAFGPAFDKAGNIYVSDFVDGNIYKFPPSGGVAGAATLLTKTSLGQTLGQILFDKGDMYVIRAATAPGGSASPSEVLQIDPATGAVIKTVFKGLFCAPDLAADPLSGDLFSSNTCGGDATLYRITNPTGPAPAATPYVTLPITVPATIAFLPSGTAYVEAFGGTPIVARVSGTNVSPTTATTVPGVTPTTEGIVAQGTGSDAQFLILNQAGEAVLPDKPRRKTSPPIRRLWQRLYP